MKPNFPNCFPSTNCNAPFTDYLSHGSTNPTSSYLSTMFVMSSLIRLSSAFLMSSSTYLLSYTKGHLVSFISGDSQIGSRLSSGSFLNLSSSLYPLSAWLLLKTRLRDLYRWSGTWGFVSWKFMKTRKQVRLQLCKNQESTLVANSQSNLSNYFSIVK